MATSLRSRFVDNTIGALLATNRLVRVEHYHLSATYKSKRQAYALPPQRYSTVLLESLGTIYHTQSTIKNLALCQTKEKVSMSFTNKHIVQNQLVFKWVIVQMWDFRHIRIQSRPIPGHEPHTTVNDDIYSLSIAIAYRSHKPSKST